MSARPFTLDAEASAMQAAQLMRDRVVGIVPIVADGRLVGLVTDRDLAERLVARGLDARTTRVADLMTAHAATCFADDDAEEAVDRMVAHAVRRLIVVDRNDGRVAGVLSIDDLARAPEHSHWVVHLLNRLNRLRDEELDGLPPLR